MRILNRTEAPPATLIGQRLGIHAGKRVDGDGLVACKKLGFEIAPDDMPISAIIAVATVIGWIAPNGGTLTGPDHRLTQRLELLRHNPWWASPLTGWVLDDVIALPEPVPCRGMQGVWWADQATVAKVFEQLDAAKAVAHA
jgi:hypothetical protein